MAEPQRAKRGVLGWAGAGGLLLAGAAALLLPVLTGKTPEETPDVPGPMVETVLAAPVDGPITLPRTGFLRAGAVVTVAPEVSGRITEIGDGFRLGGRVEKGALLVALDPRPFQADLAAAEAGVRQAEAQLAEAEAGLARQRALEVEDLVPEATLEDVRAAQLSAEAQLAQARASRQSAELRLADARVTAPFDALVLSSDAAVGQLVGAAEPVGELALSGYGEVVVGLSERQFAQLGRAAVLGRPAAVHPLGAPGAARPATVTAVSPLIEAQSRTIDIVASLEAPFRPDGEAPPLQIGEVVSLLLALPEAEVPLYAAPTAAVQVGDTLWRVEDERLRPLQAEIRHRTDGWVWFTSPEAAEARLLATEIPVPVEGLRVRTAEGALDPGAPPRLPAIPEGAPVAIPAEVAVGAAGRTSAGGAGASSGEGATAGGDAPADPAGADPGGAAGPAAR